MRLINYNRELAFILSHLPSVPHIFADLNGLRSGSEAIEPACSTGGEVTARTIEVVSLHQLVAALAATRKPNPVPLAMVAFVVVDDVLSDILPMRRPSIGNPRISVDFVPLRTRACLPSFAAEVAEFMAAGAN